MTAPQPSARRPFRAAFLTWPPFGPERFDTAVEFRWWSRIHGRLRHALNGWFEGGGGTCYLVPFEEDMAALAAVEVDVVCFPELVDYAADRTNESANGPDARNQAQTLIFAACEWSGDRMAIVDPPPDLGVQEVHDWRMSEFGADTAYGALYYPWIRVAGSDGELVTVPPCGHVAAAWARATSSAAGNVALQGVLDVAVDLTTAEVDYLTRAGINPLRAMAGWGIRTWGARTLSSRPDSMDIAKMRLTTALKRASNNYQH